MQEMLADKAKYLIVIGSLSTNQITSHNFYFVQALLWSANGCTWSPQQYYCLSGDQLWPGQRSFKTSNQYILVGDEDEKGFLFQITICLRCNYKLPPVFISAKAFNFYENFIPYCFTNQYYIMKHVIFLMCVAIGSICISCNDSGNSVAAKKNMEVNEAITKAYESGDFSKMSDYIAEDAIDHSGEKGDVKGRDNIIAEMKRYRTMMPDIKSVTTKTLADDEYVFTWSITEGTMNGQKISMTGVDIAKFKDGKAVEHWMYMDPKEVTAMMQQMPAPAPAIDTVKPSNSVPANK